MYTPDELAHDLGRVHEDAVLVVRRLQQSRAAGLAPSASIAFTDTVNREVMRDRYSA